MGIRYEYQSPGLLRSLFLTLSDRLLSQKTPLVWILDKQSGSRFSLDDQEQEILTDLADSLSHFDGLTYEARVKLTDRTFDAVVDAFSAKRRGETARFDALSQWRPVEWAGWLQSELQKVDT